MSETMMTDPEDERFQEPPAYEEDLPAEEDVPEEPDEREQLRAAALEGWGLTAAQMKAQAHDAPPALIEGLLPAAAVVLLAGEPGVGKSFVALSWAASVAAGAPWCGRAVSAGSGRVAYVLGEGYLRFGQRIEAWETTHGQQLGEGLIFVDGARRGVDLADPEKAEELVEKLELFEPDLVILDTFSMLAHVKSENDNAEIAKVFSVAHRIVSRTGASVVIVHHLSKGGTIRGASAFVGNVDGVVACVPTPSDAAPRSFALSTDRADGGKVRDGEPVRLDGFSVASPGVLAQDAAVAQHGEAARELSGLLAG